MTDWLSGAAMLLSGLIVGFMFIYGMKRREERSDLERKDLEAKRDALIAQLRVETNAEERARLETEAAEVLRNLDGLAPSSVSADRRPATGDRRPAFKGFLWGAGSVVVLAAIGFFVMKSSKPKENADSVAQLEQAVQKSPNDLALRDDLAKAYLDRENMNGVVAQTQFVLQRSPDDARALTYQALVRIAMGQGDAALQMLQRATQSDPNLIDAWVGLAWVNAQAGKMSEAQAAIDEAKRRHPDQAQRLDMLRSRFQPATAIHITLTLASSAQPAQGVIFVIARAEGVTSGPPIAVKRLPLGSFPMTVEISSADSMTGQQLPPRVRVETRLDADGDPLTRSSSDLTAVKDGVTLGSSISMALR